MPRKKRTKTVNVNQKEKLMTLFEEASDDSEVPEDNSSQEDSEESERSADERRGIRGYEEGTDTSSHDPFSDNDGEYGSDQDYEPDEDECITTDASSDSANSTAGSEQEGNICCSNKPVQSQKKTSFSVTSPRPAKKSTITLAKELPAQNVTQPIVPSITPRVNSDQSSTVVARSTISDLASSSSVMTTVSTNKVFHSNLASEKSDSSKNEQESLPVAINVNRISLSTVENNTLTQNTINSTKPSTDKVPSPILTLPLLSLSSNNFALSTHASVGPISNKDEQVPLSTTVNIVPAKERPDEGGKRESPSLPSTSVTPAKDTINSTTPSVNKIPSPALLGQNTKETTSPLLTLSPNVQPTTLVTEEPTFNKEEQLSLSTLQKNVASVSATALDGDIQPHLSSNTLSTDISPIKILQNTVRSGCDEQIELPNASRQIEEQTVSTQNIQLANTESTSPQASSHKHNVMIQDNQLSPKLPERLVGVPDCEQLPLNLDGQLMEIQSSTAENEVVLPPSPSEEEQNLLEQAGSSLLVQMPDQQSISADQSDGRSVNVPLPSNENHQINTFRSVSPTVDEIWEETTAPIVDFEFDTGNVGTTVPLDDSATPLDVLELLFTDEILNHIVTCTNAYGVALCNQERPHTRGSRKRAFKPTDSIEMKKFLGLCLLQGQLDSPNIRKLFTCTDPLYYHPIFPYTMSGRRFEQLLRCLCISELNSKGMNKVRVFVDKVIRNFQNLYKPHKQLSLDESMLPFRGRLSFRQYIKAKKAKYGIKFYVLATDDGYVLNFIIYEGKNTPTEDDANTSKLEKLVLKLMQPYLLKGHELYMDNYYNSVSLSKKLLDQRTHTIGTLRKDRKENPKEFCKKPLKTGDHMWVRKGKVYISMWKDKRPVYMITTKHHPSLVVSRNRFGKLKRKPVEIVDYNNHMSGIDKSDQMTSYYSTPKKSIRWYKKVFFRVFDMIICNAFYIFKKYCDSRSTLLSFRESIINSYLQITQQTFAAISKMSIKKNASRRKKITSPARDAASTSAAVEQVSGHWPELIPLTANTKRNKLFLKCRVCTKNKITKQTSYRCKGCVEKPPLCPGCFETWHTNPEL